MTGLQPNESRTRIVDVREGRIEYTIKASGTKDYFSYDEILYRVLCSNILKPYRGKDGRSRVKVYNNGRDANFLLYDVAMACYMGVVSEDTFLEDMFTYRRYKLDSDLVVDHADDNKNNNTRYNISLMTRDANNRKKGIVSRFRRPFIVVPCYVDGIYRVRFQVTTHMDVLIAVVNRLLFQNEKGCILGSPESTARQNLYCDNEHDFLALLDHIADRNIQCGGIEVVQRQRTDRGWRKINESCFLDDVLASIQAQECLAKEPLHVFDRFTVQNEQ